MRFRCLFQCKAKPLKALLVLGFKLHVKLILSGYFFLRVLPTCLLACSFASACFLPALTLLFSLVYLIPSVAPPVFSCFLSFSFSSAPFAALFLVRFLLRFISAFFLFFVFFLFSFLLCSFFLVLTSLSLYIYLYISIQPFTCYLNFWNSLLRVREHEHFHQT